MKITRPLLLALALAGASTGFAGPSSPDASAAGPLREAALETLGDLLATKREHALSPAQRQHVAEVLAAFGDEITRQARTRLDAQRDLHAAIFGGAGDPAVRAAAERVGQTLAEGAILRTRIVTAVKPLLTAEQELAWRGFFERLDRRIDVLLTGQL